jgi:hypothetical protein
LFIPDATEIAYNSRRHKFVAQPKEASSTKLLLFARRIAPLLVLTGPMRGRIVSLMKSILVQAVLAWII